MLLPNGAERLLELVKLNEREPNFPASVCLRVEKANDDPHPCIIVADGNLEDALRNALDVGHDRRV